MADSLYDLLVPYFDQNPSLDDGVAHPSSQPPQPPPPPPPPSTSQTTANYLARLSTLSLEALKTTEPDSLAQASHSNLVSLQALSNRSHRSFVSSADHLSSLQTSIPQLAAAAATLNREIPALDDAAVRFSSTYAKTAENPILERRKQSMQLLSDVDRVADIMELPTLLSTVVSSASTASAAAAAAATSPSPSGRASAAAATAPLTSASYSSALDLLAHIRRLQMLYPESALVQDVARQADAAMREMTSNLIGALRAKNVRLAAAMRTIGWLRRVAPELEAAGGWNSSGTGTGTVAGEGLYGALFLVCRLANLVSTLEALGPLRELADQETRMRVQGGGAAGSTAQQQLRGMPGQQTERFLKRYIEIFREQSFAVVSLYKNIFAPAPAPAPATAGAEAQPQHQHQPAHTVPGVDLRMMGLQTSDAEGTDAGDPLPRLPTALATFPMHLVQLLTTTLKQYLPNVSDSHSRESLLTQVLYCAGSLGRLGGNFSLQLAFMGDEDEDEDEGEDGVDAVAEWEEIMRKHRMLAARLDKMTAGGVDALKMTPGVASLAAH